MVCNEDYAKKREREIEHKKAKGAAEYKGDGDKDARIAKRQGEEDGESCIQKELGKAEPLKPKTT